MLMTLCCAMALGASASNQISAPNTAAAPPTMPNLSPEKLTQISSHVWAIFGFPNIAIIVGKKATLVVDTGLGTPNGRVAAMVAAKLGSNQPLYVVTTHFHPEHSAGFGGFPAGTVLIRPAVQQTELERDNGQMLARFRVNNGSVLVDADYGKPTVLFKKEYDVDLGGVHARALWSGPAHTIGDTEVFIPEDGVLVTGDVVQNRTGPTFFGGDFGPCAWLKTLAPLAALHPKIVIPDHSAPGPGSILISEEQRFMRELIDRTNNAKKAGLDEVDAQTQILAILRKDYPDWNISDRAGEGVMRAWLGH